MMTKEQLLQRRADDVKQVMSTEQGRRFIWSMLEQAGVFCISFTGEVNTTIFNEGKRNSGLALFNEVMGFCPDLYLKMAAEAKADREANYGNSTAESDQD